MSDCDPRILTFVVQSSNSSDTMYGRAQLHWQSSMAMDSRDDNDDFCLRAEDMALGPKSLNTLECSLAGPAF